MLALLDKIDKGTLWRCYGGLVLPENKSRTNNSAIERLPLAKQILVPLNQIGSDAQLAVEVGQHVTKGQALTQGSSINFLAAHAPTSGRVSKIEMRQSNHPSALPVLTCIIETDGLDQEAQNAKQPLTLTELSQLSSDDIRHTIQMSGIAGLGGAAFPTHRKLDPSNEIDILIINGVECEPYITADDRLMCEYSDEILTGIDIIYRLVKPKRVVIAIEDNKKQAIKLIRQALVQHQLPQDKTSVTAIPTRYPSGGEKQLIQLLTGLEVPTTTIPSKLGILVQNISTAFAIQQAVQLHKPLIERVVTITGDNCAKPGNYWLPIGTPISHLLHETQFKGDRSNKIIVGGPMMGYTLSNPDVPIIKGSNCILLPSVQEFAPASPELPCLRCGECAQVCPANLLPQQLFWHAQAKEYDKAAKLHLSDCIECGCCSYVCPSNIPLVEHYRIAKSALSTQAKEKLAAEQAKQRFEARNKRLEDERLAREAKQKAASERRKASMSGNDKDAIAAAMARIKAKKTQKTDSTLDTEAPMTKTSTTQPVTKTSSAPTVNASTEKEDKRAKVAAAIARAKAKKMQQKVPEIATEKPVESITNNTSDSSSSSSTEKEDKRAKVAAAVARAKAKKAARLTEQQQNSDKHSDKNNDTSNN